MKYEANYTMDILWALFVVQFCWLRTSICYSPLLTGDVLRMCLHICDNIPSINLQWSTIRGMIPVVSVF